MINSTRNGVNAMKEQKTKLRMRHGIISDECGETAQQQITVITALQKEGIYPGAEIRSVNGKYPPDHDLQETRRIASAFKTAKIPIHAIAGGLGKFPLQDEDEYAKQLDTVSHYCQVANIYETNIIRMFFGVSWQDCRNIIGLVEKFARDVLERLDEDKILAVECERATNAAFIWLIAEVIKRIGDKRLRILFDPGNYLYAVETIMALTTIGRDVDSVIMEHIRQFAKLIVLVHIKNLLGGMDAPDVLRPDTVDLDKGSLNIDRILRALKQWGYTGPVDLESHRKKAGQQIEETQRLKPGGKGYGDPEIAAKDIRMLDGWLKAIYA